MRNRFLVIAVALVLLVVSSSCIQSRPPAPSPAPEAQSTLKSSPSPSNPTLPPEVEKGLLILSHSTYVDTFGYFHVVGEFRNLSSKSTELNQDKVTFLDMVGNPGITASAYSYLNIIAPAQTSPFEVVFPSPPQVINYKMELSWQVTTRQGYSGIKVISDSLRLVEESWGQLEGEVKNNGDRKAERVIIVATFYDKSGKVIGAGFTKARMLPLRPGETSPFTLVISPKIALNMETYSIQVESLVEN